MTYTSKRLETLTQNCSQCDELTEAESSSYNGENCIVCDDCDSHYQWCIVCGTHGLKTAETLLGIETRPLTLMVVPLGGVSKLLKPF